MDKADLSVRLEDEAKILESAIALKGPFVLEIDGIKTIVNREQFLEFCIDVAIDCLRALEEGVVS